MFTVSEVNEMEKMIVDCLGEFQVLDEIIRALNYEDKAEIYSFFIRCYDLAELDED